MVVGIVLLYPTVQSDLLTSCTQCYPGFAICVKRKRFSREDIFVGEYYFQTHTSRQSRCGEMKRWKRQIFTQHATDTPSEYFFSHNHFILFLLSIIEDIRKARIQLLAPRFLSYHHSQLHIRNSTDFEFNVMLSH